MFLKVLTKYCYEVIFEEFQMAVPFNFMLTTNTNFKFATRTIDNSQKANSSIYKFNKFNDI